jgi:hypothetical protein
LKKYIVRLCWYEKGHPLKVAPRNLPSCSWYGASLQLESLNYLTRVGEPASFTLGKHELTICDNIKDAFTPGHQLCFYTKGIAQFVRQTGGRGLIVSLLAKMYINFHDVPAADSALSKYSFVGSTVH